MAPAKGYNEKRGAAVIAFARETLDKAAPLASESWKNIGAISVESGGLKPALKDPSQFNGTGTSSGSSAAGSAVRC